jgi:hypothetical protein
MSSPSGLACKKRERGAWVPRCPPGKKEGEVAQEARGVQHGTSRGPAVWRHNYPYPWAHVAGLADVDMILEGPRKVSGAPAGWLQSSLGLSSGHGSSPQ